VTSSCHVVLPYRTWFLFFTNSHLGTSRNVREKKIGILFFYTERRRKNIVGTWYPIIRYSIVRKTPTTWENALVVSTPETTRGLYTLPSRSRQLSPKTIFVVSTCSPSGKIEILRVIDSFYEKKSKNPLSNPTSFKQMGTLHPRMRHSVAFFFINHYCVGWSFNRAEAES